MLEIFVGLMVIYLGKFNDKVLLDIDVLGFVNFDVVFRVYVDICLEGNEYFLEDVGSVNGIYVNYMVFFLGNCYLLCFGDCFVLGKGDLVIFIF